MKKTRQREYGTINDLLHQMVHEGLQRDIVRKYRLRCHAATISSSGVCGRRVELRQKETCLRTPSVTNDETGQWEPISDKLL